MPESHLGGIFFDAEPPKPPEEIFGFSTDAALKLGWALEGVSPVSRRLSADGHVLQGVIELFPLMEKVQAGENVTPQDVRPYRSAIKRVVHPIETADEILKTLSIIPPFALGRVALNKFLEREFVKKVPVATAKAREYIPRAEPYVELMARFDNPRNEFIDEIRAINADVLSAVTARGPEPSAREAAQGIRQVLFGELLQNPGAVAASLPMLSGALMIRNQRARPVRVLSEPLISALAPAILTMLAAPLPKEERRPDIVASITRASAGDHLPHPLRHDQIHAFAEAAPVLLPSMRDLIPTDGREITERFEQVKEFLRA